VKLNLKIHDAHFLNFIAFARCLRGAERMSIETTLSSNPNRETISPLRARWELFLISLLLLFLELACIRWFPAHVPYLTFFTNTVLLACFLGMSLGCLAARWSQDFFTLDADFTDVLDGCGSRHRVSSIWFGEGD
jgi:hypothetical protein